MSNDKTFAKLEYEMNNVHRDIYIANNPLVNNNNKRAVMSAYSAGFMTAMRLVRLATDHVGVDVTRSIELHRAHYNPDEPT